MIQCELGINCRKKSWYHPTCINADVDSLPRKLKAKIKKMPLFQLCLADKMLCQLLHVVQFCTDVWFCSKECERFACRSQVNDGVREYSKALLWEGLNHIVRREAIRYGDGQSIIDYWAMDIIQFANKGHHKYFILAHQLLAGKCYHIQ